MKVRRLVAISGVAALVAAGGIGAGVAAATAGDPNLTITGAGNSTGTEVTWTITVSGLTDLTSTTGVTLLFPSHPAGSTTDIGPPGSGPVLQIVGNGSVVFHEFPADGTTFCGENIDVSVDLLEAADRLPPNPAAGGFPFTDVPGSTTVTCVPPTTTTTGPVVTTTTLPPVTTTTTPGVTTTTVHPDPTPTTAPAPTTPTTQPLVNISQEQKAVVVAPGVTGGNG